MPRAKKIEERIKSEIKPEKIEPKVAEKPQEIKHSWLVFEAPDKNGKKIMCYQGKAKIMKEFLLSQPEIATFIPRDPNEDKSVEQVVNLNGYKLEIPKNTYVSLPLQVHEVIRAALEQTEKAFSDMNARYGLDRDSKSIEALI